MIDRNKQWEVCVLVIYWILGAMIQLMITDKFGPLIGDRLLFGFLLSLLFGVFCFLFGGRLELETALITTTLVAVFIGSIPIITGTGSFTWRYPLFFVECAPAAALLWRLIYLFVLWISSWKIVKANSPSKAIVPEQVVEKETEKIKKEEKPIEKPVEPPVKPTKPLPWRLD